MTSLRFDLPLSPTVRSWVVKLDGGQSVAISFPGNPTLSHDGGHTIWSVVGDRDTMVQLQSTVQRVSGATVAFWDTLGAETPYDPAEADAVYWTPLCALCTWWDTDFEACGTKTWAKDIVQALLAEQEKARADVDACPLDNL